MLQVFYLDVAYVFTHMLQVYFPDILSVLDICCIQMFYVVRRVRGAGIDGRTNGRRGIGRGEPVTSAHGTRHARARWLGA
jgi:hypothetical protein